MASFGDRVVAAVNRTGPLCAGIEPSSDLVERWGLRDDAEGLRSFCLRCIEAWANVVPVIKPQVACFERHGAVGYAVLEEVLAIAREAGLLVIADAKRGDIASTSVAYAEAWLDPISPLVSDAVTTVPYFGLGALEPLIAAARNGGRGVFVVVRSSNPEGRPLQEALLSGGRESVEDGLLREIAARNRSETDGVGPVGAVIGATLAPSAADLTGVGGILLAPGIGAQGATAADAAALFRGCPKGTVLPSASRSLLAAGPSVAGLRAAAERVRDELADVTL